MRIRAVLYILDKIIDISKDMFDEQVSCHGTDLATGKLKSYPNYPMHCLVDIYEVMKKARDLKVFK